MSTIKSGSVRRLGVRQTVAVVLLCACGAFAPGLVRASEPLKITRFTLETTKTIETPLFRQKRKESELPLKLTHDNWGFINEPAPFIQAGGHPNGQEGGADALTYTAEFDSEEVMTPAGPGPAPTRDPKDIATVLPTGLLGNPTAVPRCPLKLALSPSEAGCPAATQVGIAVIYFDYGAGRVGPVLNVTPETGQSAEFSIETGINVNYVLTAHIIHTAAGYGIVVSSNGIPNNQIVKVELSFWGVPASPIHDPERNLICSRVNSQVGVPWDCGRENFAIKEFAHLGGEKSGVAEVPFVTMPANCPVGPEVTTMKADSWEEPGQVGTNGKYEGYTERSFTMPGVVGCDLLRFDPSIGIEPDTLLAEAPVGLGVNLKVPQFEEPQRPATPEMRKAVLTFPLGISISPGIVDGIEACNESGPEGINFEGPESEERGLNGEFQLAPGHCPDASIVGEAEAETPLLGVPIKGHIYLARPGCGNASLGRRPCTEQDALDGNLYQLYLELGGTGALADTGVNIKVRLKTEANPATGQLTTVAEEVAQLPFSELRVRLNGGPRAPLDNPPMCGPATTTADLTPWSAPGTTPEGVFMPGLANVTPSSFYNVVGCASPPGLTPGFVAGTVTPNAGKFSAFTMDLSRKDREQYVKGIQVHTPPGLLGILASVPLCEETRANVGSCPEVSKIGTTRVASGAGSHPFEIEGAIYLTTSYRGAPFGLSIVTNAVAGPFDLGKVVVRARIDVSSTDSTLTITTDETGPYAVPQILFGVPLRLQRVAVDVDRPGFMFNPTNCGAHQITASISGSQGAVADVASPFAVGSCKSLVFKPTFKVSTKGHTSRALGATLDVKLSYPKGALGNDANIARVKVSLPKQLPSRLNTLQQACPAKTFDNDPAACPKASIVGIAKSTTPLLPVGLSGPVYFVSHGGEEFPSLIVVLQGDGVRVDLTGSTFIRKSITSSTFKTVPDVPVNSFELYLPQGKFSALAANGNLCAATTPVATKRKVTRRVHGRTVQKTITTHKSVPGLVMPTEFVAQNGAVIKQDTKIAVTDCGTSRIRRTQAKRKRGHSARISPRQGNRIQGRSGR